MNKTLSYEKNKLTLSCVSALLLTLTNCAHQGLTDTTESNQIEVIKITWKHRVAERVLRDPPLKTVDLIGIRTLQGLLTQAPAKLWDSEFRRICSNEVPPLNVVLDPQDLAKSLDHCLDKGYDAFLLRAFTDLAIERRDKQRLVRLLRSNCPLEIALVPLEFRMARGWPGSIELLFEAWRKSDCNGARAGIVLCLGRAFPSIRGAFPDDRVFMDNAGRWYEENKARLKLNESYPYCPGLPPSEAPPNTNLFILDGI